MAYYDERSNRIRLSEEDKRIFKKCQQYMANSRIREEQIERITKLLLGEQEW